MNNLEFYSEFWPLRTVTVVSKSKDLLMRELGIADTNIFLCRDKESFAAHLSECELKNLSSQLRISIATKPLTPRFNRWFWVISNKASVSVQCGYADSAEMLQKYLELDKSDYLSCWPVVDQKTSALATKTVRVLQGVKS
jgi:hypothetical protein